MRRDVLDPEAANQGRRRAGAIQLATYAWDAWDGALPDEAEDAHHHQRLAPSGADAEKLAARVLDGPAWAELLRDAGALQLQQWA